jgi:ribosome biogenesis protein MAK21
VGPNLKKNRVERPTSGTFALCACHPKSFTILPASTSKARLLIPATPGWFDFLPPLPNTSKPVAPRSASQLAALLDHATSLHASELAAFSTVPNAAGGSASDQAFLRNILTGGTLSDRLSALTLMVQSAPLHNIRALESLKNLAERGRSGVSASREGEKGKGKTAGREDRLKAARAFMDWWVGGGAPNRKLRCVPSTSASCTHSMSHDIGTSAINHCYTLM